MTPTADSSNVHGLAHRLSELLDDVGIAPSLPNITRCLHLAEDTLLVTHPWEGSIFRLMLYDGYTVKDLISDDPKFAPLWKDDHRPLHDTPEKRAIRRRKRIQHGMYGHSPRFLLGAVDWFVTFTELYRQADRSVDFDGAGLLHRSLLPLVDDANEGRMPLPRLVVHTVLQAWLGPDHHVFDLIAASLPEHRRFSFKEGTPRTRIVWPAREVNELSHPLRGVLTHLERGRAEEELVHGLLTLLLVLTYLGGRPSPIYRGGRPDKSWPALLALLEAVHARCAGPGSHAADKLSGEAARLLRVRLDALRHALFGHLTRTGIPLKAILSHHTELDYGLKPPDDLIRCCHEASQLLSQTP